MTDLERASRAQARYEETTADPDGYTPFEGILALIELDRAEGLC